MYIPFLEFTKLGENIAKMGEKMAKSEGQISGIVNKIDQLVRQ
jgi:hypothetical protein